MLKKEKKQKLLNVKVKKVDEDEFSLSWHQIVLTFQVVNGVLPKLKLRRRLI